MLQVMLQVITNASSERHSTQRSHVVKQKHAYWSANTLTWKAGPTEKLTQKHKEHIHNDADDDDDDNNNNNDNSNDDNNNDDDSTDDDDNNSSDYDDVITRQTLFFVLIIMIIRVRLIDATVWRGEEGTSVFIPFFFSFF